MDATTLSVTAAIASILSFVSSIIAAFVALYVKAAIGPLQTNQHNLQREIDRQVEVNERVWTHIGKAEQRIASMEGAQGK